MIGQMNYGMSWKGYRMLHDGIVLDCYRQVLKVGNSIRKMINLNVELGKLLTQGDELLVLEHESNKLKQYLIDEYNEQEKRKS